MKFYTSIKLTALARLISIVRRKKDGGTAVHKDPDPEYESSVILSPIGEYRYKEGRGRAITILIILVNPFLNLIAYNNCHHLSYPSVNAKSTIFCEL